MSSGVDTSVLIALRKQVRIRHLAHGMAALTYFLLASARYTLTSHSTSTHHLNAMTPPVPACIIVDKGISRAL